MKKFLIIAMTMAVSLVSLAAAPAVTYEKEDVRLYLRRDDCGGADNPHLSVFAGTDSEGCGFALNPANEVLYAAGDPLTESYPQAGVESYLLDHEGTFTAEIATGNWTGVGAASKGYLIVDVVVTGLQPNFFPVTLADVTEEVVLTTAPHVLSISEEIAASLAGVSISQINVDVTIRGVTTMHMTVETSGASHITIPTLVEVPEEA